MLSRCVASLLSTDILEDRASWIRGETGRRRAVVPRVLDVEGAEGADEVSCVYKSRKILAYTKSCQMYSASTMYPHSPSLNFCPIPASNAS